MIKVLDLFSGTQSVKKALKKHYGLKYWELTYKNGYPFWNGFKDQEHGKGLPYVAVQYVGIDILSPEEENLILDLSQDNIIKKIKEKLGNLKPDFIWASPVCNKLSLATAMKGGSNAYFKVDKENETIRPWPIGSFVDGAKNYQKIVGTEKAYNDAVWTLKIFDNTKKIINHFNTAFAIENPQHSLTKYIMKEYTINTCSYCMYGFEQRKNTQIFTNKKINLKKCNHRGEKPHKVSVYGKPKSQNKKLPNYTERASVPPKLIVEIMERLLNENNI